MANLLLSRSGVDIQAHVAVNEARWEMAEEDAQEADRAMRAQAAAYADGKVKKGTSLKDLNAAFGRLQKKYGLGSDADLEDQDIWCVCQQTQGIVLEKKLVDLEVSSDDIQMELLDWRRCGERYRPSRAVRPRQGRSPPRRCHPPTL